MLLAAVALALVGCAAPVAAWRLQRRFHETGVLLVRTETQLAELGRLRAGQVDAAWAALLVAGGTRVVQGVHQGIASIPFAILEAIPPTRPVARVVHLAHDFIANGVYGALSFASRAFAQRLRRD